MFEKKTKREAFWIDDVLHSAKIKVEETGTTVAASTVIHCRMVPMCGRIYRTVKFDRPFQAVVFDNTNNIPLFLTQINTLKQN